MGVELQTFRHASMSLRGRSRRREREQDPTLKLARRAVLNSFRAYWLHFTVYIALISLATVLRSDSLRHVKFTAYMSLAIVD